jgi:hypothetical protein
MSHTARYRYGAGAGTVPGMLYCKTTFCNFLIFLTKALLYWHASLQQCEIVYKLTSMGLVGASVVDPNPKVFAGSESEKKVRVRIRIRIQTLL